MNLNIALQLYIQYKDERPCWPFIGLSLTFCTIATVGIFLNISHIYVTIKTKKLHGTAFTLLALTSAFELVHLCGHYLFMFTALSGQNFVDYALAVAICALSFFALHYISPIMLFTGIDRLISIQFDNFHKSIKGIPYIGGILLLCTVHSLYSIFLLLKTVNRMPSMKITGSFGDLFQGDDLTGNLTQIAFYINGSSIIVYVITGLMILAKTKTNSNNSIQRNIFKTLCLIISVNIGGYFVQLLFRIYFLPLLSSPTTLWFCLSFSAIPLLISASSNAPILYLSSSLYREASCAEWKKFRSLIGHPSQSNSNNNNQVFHIQPNPKINNM